MDNKNLELSEYIDLGVMNTLKIDRFTPPGAYLKSQEEDDVVLLPNTYIKEDMSIGDLIDVFIYTDSEDRLVAITLEYEKPYAMKNEFIFAEVVDVLKYGAFVNWGLSKDLFVPRYMQKVPFEIGDMRILRIIEDEDTGRLIAVEKIKTFLEEVPKKLKRNTEVNLLIFAKTPLGYKAIVDNKYEGMIYKNEIFQDVFVGDTLKGYIKQTTWEQKLDISLQVIRTNTGKDIANDTNMKKILDIIKENSNIKFNYKSDAKEIKNTFSMSKKAYKKSLTKLIENKKIKLNPYITVTN